MRMESRRLGENDSELLLRLVPRHILNSSDREALLDTVNAEIPAPGAMIRGHVPDLSFCLKEESCSAVIEVLLDRSGRLD